jgi:dihydrofolate synthase/folylpolyglutamate synthase
VRRRSLSEWLAWQESLHPRTIDLGLERVRAVGGRLGCLQPSSPVFTVAGTNGKGTAVGLLEGFLLRAGKRPGAYTSPHLVAYNERIRVAGSAVGDDVLIAAFERVEAARADTPLTFFEFGTLVALEVFRTHGCESHVLEVGMGGRLDAVNAVDTDYALITTVDLDHTEYLGDTVEKIATEKAGIMRAGRPAFYGDWPVPASVADAARRLQAPLHCLGRDFDFTPAQPLWSWRGTGAAVEGLAYPHAAVAAQLRNVSLVLAAIEQFDASLLSAAIVNEVMSASWPPGRFQVVSREHDWILDVAHNPQAAATLRDQIASLPPCPDTTIVIGMLGDKSLAAFVAELLPFAQRWLTCTVVDPRARDSADIAAQLRAAGAVEVHEGGAPERALERARDLTQRGGRIVVCGSFRVVGPALVWLGIY